MPDKYDTIHVLILGRVQGVWYRAWTVEEARKHQLDGWVRNRRDGAVEAIFYGPSDLVTEMIVACRAGPPLARVDDIHVLAETTETVQKGQGFRAKETV